MEIIGPLVPGSSSHMIFHVAGKAISTSIGGLVVKLAVAMRDNISNDSASPGFDSRPMHFCSRNVILENTVVVVTFCTCDCVCISTTVRMTLMGNRSGEEANRQDSYRSEAQNLSFHSL